ncbi:hypothetical protein IAT40_005855 [Kwoniella sp. CBS 6097]
MLGLDYKAGGQLAALPEFQKQFGVPDGSGGYFIPVHYLSAWSAIGPACDLVAAVVAAPFLEKVSLAVPPRLWLLLVSRVAILAHPLIREGRTEEARQALKTLYGKQNSESFFDGELERLAIDVRATQDLTGDLPIKTIFGLPLPTADIECFKGKNLKRTWTAIWAASAQQMIGATFAIGYDTYVFDLIGFKDYFDASVVLYVVMFASFIQSPYNSIHVNGNTHRYTHSICVFQ